MVPVKHGSPNWLKHQMQKAGNDGGKGGNKRNALKRMVMKRRAFMCSNGLNDDSDDDDELSSIGTVTADADAATDFSSKQHPKNLEKKR